MIRHMYTSGDVKIFPLYYQCIYLEIFDLWKLYCFCNRAERGRCIRITIQLVVESYDFINLADEDQPRQKE